MPEAMKRKHPQADNIAHSFAAVFSYTMWMAVAWHLLASLRWSVAVLFPTIQNFVIFKIIVAVFVTLIGTTGVLLVDLVNLWVSSHENGDESRLREPVFIDNDDLYVAEIGGVGQAGSDSSSYQLMLNGRGANNDYQEEIPTLFGRTGRTTDETRAKSVKFDSNYIASNANSFMLIAT